MPKITSPFPPVPIDRDATQTDEDALVDLVRTAAGNVATLYGVVLGPDEIADNTPNPAPLAPGHSIRTHDHSGGWYGRPLRRTIYSVNMGEGQDLSSFISKNARNWFFSRSGMADGTKAIPTGKGFQAFPVAVPGCDPIEGAYNTLQTRAQVWVDSVDTLLAADTVTLRVLNVTTGHEVTFDVTTNTTGEQLFISSASDNPSTLLNMKVGAINMLIVDFLVELTGTGGTRSVSMQVMDFQLSVLET